MKLITFAIPSYNSEKFLASCLDSLLIGIDEKIEAIVINDGSTDKTSEIAHEYSKKYPFIKVVDKENGGHGSGINVGIVNATGLYFKMFDSDDHVDKEGLLSLIEIIEKHLNLCHDNLELPVELVCTMSCSEVSTSRTFLSQKLIIGSSSN